MEKHHGRQGRGARSTKRPWGGRKTAIYGIIVCWNMEVLRQFEYKVERCFHRDSLMRQIEEADRLECEQGSLLNDKMEFVQPYGLQVKATRMGH